MKDAEDGKGGFQMDTDAELMLADFIRGNNAKNCLKCGTRVEKIGTEDGDRTPDGTAGTVLGSMWDEQGVLTSRGHLIHGAYLIEWDNDPGAAVFVCDVKIKEAQQE